MVAFVIIVKFIVYFFISLIVQNDVIDKGEMSKYFTKYVVVCFFPLNNIYIFIYIYGERDG